MKQTIFLALMETRHFSFSAAGATESEAKDALVAGWAAHRNEYPGHVQRDMPDANLAALEKEFTVSVLPMTLGAGYRDHELIRVI